MSAAPAAALAARLASPDRREFSLPLPRATVTVLTQCGHDVVAAGSRDGLLMLIDLCQDGPKRRCVYEKLERPAVALAADWDDGGGPSHLFVSTGSSDIERLVVDADIAAPADELPERLVGHSRGAVTALAANDGLLCSAGNDMTVRLWDSRACVALALLATDVEPPCALALCSEVRLLLSASYAGAGALSVWRLPTLLAAAGKGKRDHCLAPVVSAVVGGLARVSGSLAGAGSDGSRHGGSLRGGARWLGGGGEETASAGGVGGACECVHTLPLASNQIHAVCVAPGGLAALSASHTGELQCWSLDMEAERFQEEKAWGFAHVGHSEPIRALALVGDALVTCSGDRSLRVARCPPAATGGGTNGQPRGGSWSFGLGGLDAATADATASGEAPERPTDRAEAERSVEEVLQGVEDAAEELAWPSL